MKIIITIIIIVTTMKIIIIILIIIIIYIYIMHHPNDIHRISPDPKSRYNAPHVCSFNGSEHVSPGESPAIMKIQ
jgi:hypothetical protein